MTLPIIAVNISGSEVVIDDLGIILPADSTAVLSDIFLRHQIQDSADLKSKINGGDIVINDGSNTLSVINSIKHVTFETEYEDKESLGPGYHVGSSPPDPNVFNGWYNTNDKILYSYDSGRGKWLSVNRRLYQFNKAGETIGNEYFKIGEVQSSDAGYVIPRDGTIVSVSARSASGFSDKEFELRNSGTKIKSFKYTNGQINDSTCNVDVNIENILQCFDILEADTGEDLSDWAYTNRVYRRKITLKKSEIAGDITYDSAVSNGATAASSVSVSHTLAGGSVKGVFAFAATEEASPGVTVTGITYNGTAMTEVATVVSDDGGFQNRISLYYLDVSSLSSGSYTVAASFSGAADVVFVAAVSLIGAAKVTPTTFDTDANVSTSSIDIDLTVSKNASWIVSGAVCGNSTSFTSTNNTIRTNQSAGSAQLATGTRADLSTGTQNCDYTNTGANRLAMVGAVVEPYGDTLQNFPVLVEINRTLFTQINDDASDLVFTDSTGGLLSYEIEDSTGSSIIAWVKIPEISGAEDLEIYAYYGYDEATSLENASDVWSNSYDNIYHLADDPSSGVISDSLNNDNGTPNNMGSENIFDGQINGSLDFNGSNEDITINAAYEFNPDGGTVSLWLRRDNTLRTEAVFGNQDNAEIRFDSANNNVYADFYDRVLQSTTNLSNTSLWYYVVHTWNNLSDNAYLYVNGVEEDSSSIPEGFPFPGSLRIGSRAGTNYFDGKIDEVRISSVARSQNWIETEFNNQNNPSNFYTIGNEESIPAAKVTDTIFLVEVAWRAE